MPSLDGRIRDRISVLTPDRGMAIGFPAGTTPEDVERFRRHLEAQPLAPNICRMQIERGLTIYPGVERMHAALFAVLDLHRPNPVLSGLGPYCEVCVGGYEGVSGWPCRTVRAIAGKLGVEVGG